MPQQQRLSDAVDTFLASRSAVNGLAKNTLRQERYQLVGFLTSTGNIYVSSITPQHVDDFFASKVGVWGDGAYNLARTRLNTFFRFCRQRRWMASDNDPMAHTTHRKVEKEDRLRLTPGEFPRLLDIAETYHPRNRMIVALGLFLFLRASEIKALRKGDVHLDRGEITVHVMKSRKFDSMPISKPLERELRKWLTTYTELVGGLSDDMYLVPSFGPVPGTWDATEKCLVNEPWHVSRAPLRPKSPCSHPEQAVQRALETMGFPSFKEGCHTLRRSGARAYFDEKSTSGGGFDPRALEIVSTMLHHKQMATTQVYLGIAESVMHRDNALKGQEMFAAMEQENVIVLRPEVAQPGPVSA